LNDGNFRSKQLTDTAGKSGLSEVWALIANSADIEAYTAEPNLETRKNKLIQSWNDIFDERDTIVHRVSQANGWSSSRIREAVALVELVFSRLSACLVSDAEIFIADVQRIIAATEPAE